MHPVPCSFSGSIEERLCTQPDLWNLFGSKGWCELLLFSVPYKLLMAAVHKYQSVFDSKWIIDYYWQSYRPLMATSHAGNVRSILIHTLLTSCIKSLLIAVIHKYPATFGQ